MFLGEAFEYQMPFWELFAMVTYYQLRRWRKWFWGNLHETSKSSPNYSQKFVRTANPQWSVGCTCWKAMWEFWYSQVSSIYQCHVVYLFYNKAVNVLMCFGSKVDMQNCATHSIWQGRAYDFTSGEHLARLIILSCRKTYYLWFLVTKRLIGS